MSVARRSNRKFRRGLTRRGRAPSAAAVTRLPLLLLALGACSLEPAYDVAEQPLPHTWEHVDPAAESRTLGREWWRAYGSAELDRLMARAVAGNQDVAAAGARIEQARANLGTARAALWPFASASGSVSSDRVRNGETLGSEDSRIGLSIDYAVDLRGANRNAIEAAELRLGVSEQNRAAVLLTLQTDVALAYFQLLALADRIDIAARNLQAAGDLMRLIQVRFDNGAATALDVAQQRTNLLNIEAQIPALRQATNETRHALAVLVGMPPQSFTVLKGTIAGVELPSVDPGLPAELLLRRPDIRAAEAALLAANADIGVARAAFFPDLSLSASALAADLTRSGSATVATAAASLTQILFSGGVLRERVELTRAVRQEIAANYAQTVLLALADVENALSAVTTAARRVDLLTRTVGQARETFRLARVRFDAGAIDLLTVLDSQRTLLTAEDALVQAQQERLETSAELVRALGGGWEAGRT